MVWTRQLRHFSWIILTILIPCGWCCPAVAAPYSGGDGTSETPYLLSTAEDLATLANTQADWGKWFLLTADVDLRSTPLAKPIGSRPAPFTGVFDGGRHSIGNLTVNDTAVTSVPFGLFGVVGLPGVVERVRLIAPSITTVGNGNTGALAGEVAKGATIQQCSAEGGTVSTPASDAAGGLVGDNGGTIRECFSTTSVTAFGLAGTLLGRNTGLVENCAAAGSVTALKVGTGTAAAGLSGADVGGTIQFCLALSPSLTGARVGGLVGFASLTTTIGNSVCNKVVVKAVGNWPADVPGSAWCEEPGNLASSAFFTGLGWDLRAVWFMDLSGALRLRWVSSGPTAVARGPSGTIQPDSGTGLARIVLDGSQSADPEGNELQYRWECLTSGGEPAGIPIESIASPTVDLPAGIYRIVLTVSNGQAESAPATLTFTVASGLPKSPPTAVIQGPTGVVRPDPATGLAQIALDGSSSRDPDQQGLKYNWKCLTASGQATGVTISPAARPSLSLRPGTYRIELTVSNGTADSAPAVLAVTVNTPPVAKAGDSQNLYDDGTGARQVKLDASQSFDPEAGKSQMLTYSWTCATAQPGAASGCTASLLFPVGTHTVLLAVSDGMESAHDKLQITVLASLPSTRTVASPTTVGRTSTIPDVKFYLLLPAGKTVSAVDTQTPIYLDLNGTRIPLPRDPTYGHKKCTVVTFTDRQKILAAAGATNGPKTATVSLRLKTGEMVCGAVHLEIVPGFGPNLATVLAERTAYYLDTKIWK